MFRHNRFPDGGWMAFNRILPLILCLVLIGVVVWAVTRFTRGNPASTPPPHDPALEELRQAYARGQVTRDEFLQKQADLTGPPAPPLSN